MIHYKNRRSSAAINNDVNLHIFFYGIVLSSPRNTPLNTKTNAFWEIQEMYVFYLGLCSLTTLVAYV